MKKRFAPKLISLALCALLLTGLLGGAAGASTVSTADFEVLAPLMDLVCTASMYSANELESVPGADGTLTVTFTDSFILAGQQYGAQVGVTEAMLNDTNAQAALLSQIFAAQLPQLEPVVVTDSVKRFVGFHPVTVNNATEDGSIQIIGELYFADKPVREMNDAEFAGAQWFERGVFTFQSDATALNGFRLVGFSVGTDLSVESIMQGYFENILVEYVNANLGFTVLYPAVFTDDLLVESADGVTAELPDGSAKFFVKRLDNENSLSLSDYVSIIANGITGSVSSVNEELGSGTVTYTTAEGYTVFDVFIVTDQHIYQAELSYLTTQAENYSMYNAYLENSFVADEVSVG